MTIVNLLFAIAIIALLAAPYFLCLLLLSDLLIRWILRRLLERQLHIDLPIAEVKRKIHNTEYIRPIPGSALGLGVIFGIIGWVAIFGGVIPRISQSASGVYLGQFSLFDSLSIFVLLSVIGIGCGMLSYEPGKSPTASDEGEDEQPVTHLYRNEGAAIGAPGCGGCSSLFLLVTMLSIGIGVSELQTIRCIYVMIALASLVGFSQSLTRILRIMKREIDSGKEE